MQQRLQLLRGLMQQRLELPRRLMHQRLELPRHMMMMLLILGRFDGSCAARSMKNSLALARCPSVLCVCRLCRLCGLIWAFGGLLGVSRRTGVRAEVSLRYTSIMFETIKMKCRNTLKVVNEALKNTEIEAYWTTMKNTEIVSGGTGKHRN